MPKVRHEKKLKKRFDKFSNEEMLVMVHIDGAPLVESEQCAFKYLPPKTPYVQLIMFAMGVMNRDYKGQWIINLDSIENIRKELLAKGFSITRCEIEINELKKR